MRTVIQRVSEAACRIDNEVSGAIGPGFLVLLGIEEADTPEDLEWLANKIINMRVFEDEQGMMNKALADISGNILLISQFTLFASTRKGNRPGFTRAAKPDLAIPLYEAMVKRLSQLLNKPIQTGIFGADMKVTLINDGPVTVTIDTKNKE